MGGEEALPKTYGSNLAHLPDESSAEGEREGEERRRYRVTLTTRSCACYLFSFTQRWVARAAVI